MSDRKWVSTAGPTAGAWMEANGLATPVVAKYQDEWVAWDRYGPPYYASTRSEAQHIVNRWAGKGCSYCFSPDFNGRDCRIIKGGDLWDGTWDGESNE